MSEIGLASGGVEPLASVSATASGGGRRERRRVGALLTAYYGIEERGEAASSSSAGAARHVEVPLDREEFDAKKHFDTIVAGGLVADVMRHANQIDSEVRDLNGDMQMVVYENYSKFLRSMEVTKEMKVSVQGLDADLKSLEGSFARISEHQRQVEDGVSSRAGEIEGLLKKQRMCAKLQVLFDLPTTLQRCLDQGAYGRAVEAYSCCAGFLRQHKDVTTLQHVLQDVEHQMSRIRSALEHRLRSSELSVTEAANSAVTLLDLGQERAQVERDYLSGRAASQRALLERCLAPAEPVSPEERSEGGGMGRPQDTLFKGVCVRATVQYLPGLRDAAEGFQKLCAGCEATHTGMLESFVTAGAEELFARLTGLIDTQRPPVNVVVACVTSLKDATTRLHALLPGVMPRLVSDFVGSAVTAALKAHCSQALSSLASDFLHLHEECRRLQDSKSSGVEALLEEVAKAEQSVAAGGLTAVSGCQPLLGLVAAEAAASKRLVRGVREMLVALLLGFSQVAWCACGREPPQDWRMPAASLAELQGALSEVQWTSLFGLALVWLGRRWEERVVGKAWATAVELLAALPGVELTPEPSLAAATRAATEATITHFVLVGGQHLAHYLRNSVWNRNWMAVAKEPQEPSLVVEMVLKEVDTFDAQLARILGEPRKPRGNSHRRVFTLNKSSMELELELLMARKLQAFAPIPFSRKGAIAGILRIAFKALYEYVREQTFTKFGLQQVQVDANLFAELVRDFVDTEDASTLSNLLGEVVHSASQRCVDPVLMEEAAVEALCDRKKRNLSVE